MHGPDPRPRRVRVPRLNLVIPDPLGVAGRDFRGERYPPTANLPLRCTGLILTAVRAGAREETAQLWALRRLIAMDDQFERTD